MLWEESLETGRHRWWDALLSAVFPSHCALCRAFVEKSRDRGICPACWARIPRVPRPFCLCCGLPLPAHEDLRCGLCRTHPPLFATARAYGLYQQELRELIHLFKFGGRQDLANPLGLRMASAYDPLPADSLPPVVIPVPLHPKRLRRRGFNQAELLAGTAARILDLPVYSHGLKRKKDTLPQSGLSDRQRLENVQAAFEVKTFFPISGRRVLLVDDVLTTGATLNACSKVLLAAGAARVDVLTLARVPHLH
jgi:ComF family protein